MDCSTARLFIPFHRPGGHDLDGPEAAELDAHLAQCTDCNTIALTQDRLDAHLGKAMRAVEVPRHLREQILQRLAAEPRPRSQRWLGHGTRIGAVAAALLLIVGTWYLFYTAPKQNLSGDEVFVHVNIDQFTQEEANLRLRQLGARPAAPGFVNYAFLVGAPSLAVLPGTQDLKSPVKVPQFIFQEGIHRVVIYALPQRQFRLEQPQSPGDGYTYQFEIIQPESSEFAYLVFYTNGHWAWLKAPYEID